MPKSQEKPIECPLKVGYICPLINSERPDERMVLDGFCNGICPVSEIFFNNDRRCFSTPHGLSPELFRPRETNYHVLNRPDAPLLTIYDDQGATA